MTKHTEEFLQRVRDVKQRITEVSPAEAQAEIFEGALLDVREKDEFESGHIDGAMNISSDTLEK